MEKEATEKSTLRNKSIGTKVSEEEHAALEKLAEARGLTLGEWLRKLVLAELIAHPAEQTILAEILAEKLWTPQERYWFPNYLKMQFMGSLGFKTSEYRMLKVENRKGKKGAA